MCTGMANCGKIERISLPCGKTAVEVEVPAANLLGVYASRDGKPASDPLGLLQSALACPISTPPLRELAAGARKVLLIVDDNTRRTPVARMLPAIVDCLAAAGVPEEGVKILFATGTHREMTEAERIAKVGRDIFLRYECAVHDYLAECVSLGTTGFGTPVAVNPLLLWADLKIAIGSVMPHAFCGWAGGGKMILPGVCGAPSILATHLLPVKDPGIALGVPDNRARREIDEAARMAGLDFIVNTILDASGNIVDLVAGDPAAAHRAGVEKARGVQGVRIPAADLVIGSAYPEDGNYWQAGKSLHTMERVVVHGGLAVLVAALPEGRGEHPGLFDAMGEERAVLLDRLAALQGGDIDEALAVAAALADRRILDKARLGLVSGGLPQGETAGGAFARFANPTQAVRRVLADKPDARVVCLLNCPEILPL